MLEQKTQKTRRAPEDPRLKQAQKASLTTVLTTVAMILGGLLLVSGLAWFGVLKVFGTGPITLLVISAICFIYAIAANFKLLVASLKERRTVNGLNTLVFAILVFGILVLVNYIAIRHHWRYDASQEKQFALAEQTRKVLNSLNQDVSIIAFLRPDNPEIGVIRDRLNEYAASSQRIKLEFLDPYIATVKAQEYQISLPDTLIVKSGESKEEIINMQEEQITSAILSVTSGQKTKLYFLIGHGEFNPEETSGDSISSIKANLEMQQYGVETLMLVNQKTPVIPQDCAALVIAGAKHPLQKTEMQAVQQYIERGGKLLVALANTPQAPDFAQILTPRGITPLKGIVVEPNAGANAGNASTPMVKQPEKHQITLNLQAIVLPLVRALKVDAGVEPPPSYPGAPPPAMDKKAIALLRSSADSWLDARDASGKTNGKQDPGEEVGPLVMAAVIDESIPAQQQPGMPPAEDEKTSGARIMVIGNAEFMSDRMISYAQLYSNAYLVLNSVAWLVGNEKLISIPARQVEIAPLNMSAAQKTMATLVAVFLIPGIVMIAGVVMWWRRRR